jgi:hypothetical protein
MTLRWIEQAKRFGRWKKAAGKIQPPLFRLSGSEALPEGKMG